MTAEPENTDNNGSYRQYRARSGAPKRSYYGNAFQTDGRNSYQRMQDDASKQESPYQRQMREASLHDVAGFGISSAADGQSGASARAEGVRGYSSASAGPNASAYEYHVAPMRDGDMTQQDAFRTERPAQTTQRRTSLRRETVSPFGTELGQGSRPSSFIQSAPVEDRSSFRGGASWRSNGSIPSSAPKSGLNFKVVLGVVVLAVIVVAAAWAFLSH